MKRSPSQPKKCGFTLMELMVAMAITTIIVTVLVSITSIALDVWNRSRSELRASRQAKSMVDTMARDFESLVARSGGTNEWLIFRTPSSMEGSTALKSTNAAEMYFFSAATDRYNGDIGIPGRDAGGDVSAVAYRLGYKDPVKTSGTGDYKTFVLYRQIVNPDVAFTKILGTNDLVGAFNAAGFDESAIKTQTNFVCENVYQFSITANVKVAQKNSPSVTSIIPVILDAQSTSKNQVTSFSILGSGLKLLSQGSSFSDGKLSYTLEEVQAGKVQSLVIACSVMSDLGIDQLRNRSFNKPEDKAIFITKNSFQYSKKVEIPGR